jgi:organic radical activating enzyme
MTSIWYDISGIFNGIQGEGPATGQNVTFVRFAGCNLNCKGCDTNHAKSCSISLEDLLAQISFRKPVVLTGGEPTLQPISDFMVNIGNVISNVDLETNGRKFIRPPLFRHVVIGVKNGLSIDYRWDSYDNVHFKFVMSSRLDRPDWTYPIDKPLPTTFWGVRQDRIWVMPYGTNPELNEAKDVWDYALKYGYNYSDRLHIRVGRQ